MIEDEERRDAVAQPPAPSGGGQERQSLTENAAVMPNPSGDAANGAALQTYIGRGLRAMFDNVAQQPIPDRFIELMRKLD